MDTVPVVAFSATASAAFWSRMTSATSVFTTTFASVFSTISLTVSAGRLISAALAFPVVFASMMISSDLFSTALSTILSAVVLSTVAVALPSVPVEVFTSAVVVLSPGSLVTLSPGVTAPPPLGGVGSFFVKVISSVTVPLSLNCVPVRFSFSMALLTAVPYGTVTEVPLYVTV